MMDALTLHLDPGLSERLRALAAANDRSPGDYAENVLTRAIEAGEEAARVITMRVASDAAAVTPGVLLRSEGESDARYAERTALMDRLFAIPDSGDTLG